MPEVKLNLPAEPKPKTLAEVAENEWWLSEGGHAFCRLYNERVLRCKNGGSPYMSDFRPDEVLVSKQLSDPITLTW